MSSFTCASLTSSAGSGGTVQVQGRVASAEDLSKLKTQLAGIAGAQIGPDIAVVGRPFCEALDVLGPALAANQQGNLGLQILPGNDTGVYIEGEPLVLSITGAPYPSTVYIDYFQIDGTVVHMLPNDSEKGNTRGAGQRFLVGDAKSGQRAWPIYPPFGREMVTIVAAEKPLFATQRPEIEPGSAYLAALRDALSAQTSGKVAAAKLDVTSEPRTATPPLVAQGPMPHGPPAPAKPQVPSAPQTTAKPAPPQAAPVPVKPAPLVQVTPAPAPAKAPPPASPNPPAQTSQAAAPPPTPAPTPAVKPAPQPAPKQTAQAPAPPPAPSAPAPSPPPANTKPAPAAAPQAAAPPPAANKPAPAPATVAAKPAAPAAPPPAKSSGPMVAVTLTPRPKIGFVQGPNVCKSCHAAEYKVWSATEHFKDFADVHKSPKTPAILDAAGGDKNMRKNQTCQLCHYTLVQDDASDPGEAKAGPSCESCHGASSEWIDIHNAKDTPLDQRVTQTMAKGMIRSNMHYEVAENCMSCHGLARADVDPDIMGKMLAAGHPVSPDFELVRYSQGTVRHRFYPPDVDNNKAMSPPELSRLFVTGQAAKLISALWAASRSNVPQYKQVQTARADLARKALSAGQSVPEIAEFLRAPSEASAHKLVQAIETKDLSAQFGSQLSTDYK